VLPRQMFPLKYRDILNIGIPICISYVCDVYVIIIIIIIITANGSMCARHTSQSDAHKSYIVLSF